MMILANDLKRYINPERDICLSDVETPRERIMKTNKLAIVFSTPVC
jgi:hypothetical protein